MGSFSNYWENEILDHVLKVGSYTAPTHIYVGLSTSAPGEDGSGIIEPSGGDYARVLCDTWDAASNGASANTSAITFPEATGAWGTIAYFFLADAITAGNKLAWGQLTSSQAVVSGNTVKFNAGELDITLD